MRTEERELRDALHARAGAVPVGRADEAGLSRRLVAGRRRRQARLAAVVAALVVAVGAGSLVAAHDDQAQNVVAGPDASSTTTVPEASTTTIAGLVTLPAETSLVPPSSAPPSPSPGSSAPPGSAATTVPRTTTTAAPLPPVPDDALWPPPGSATVFPTADAAAADFVRRFLGMGTPQLSRAQVAGANGSVTVRPMATGGPPTGVSLRRVDRRGWVVVGCAAANIVVDQPAPAAAVASPLTVGGRAQAFEGHVNVEVRQDGALSPIGQSYGTGGGTEVLPFQATVTFRSPSARRGTVVVSEPRADVSDQGPADATVVRVSF